MWGEVQLVALLLVHCEQISQLAIMSASGIGRNATSILCRFPHTVGLHLEE